MGEEHPLVDLARKTIESYIREGRRIECPDELAETMRGQAGAFVSLHRSGDLRGCIGTIGPTMPTLAEEVIQNAISAATQDPRFPPLTAEELHDLDVCVDVLGPPEPISSISQLDPKKYGVIVESGRRRGLLLPDLEGVDTAEQQVEIARRKAWIGPREPVKLYRFTVTRYGHH